MICLLFYITGAVLEVARKIGQPQCKGVPYDGVPYYV